MLRYCTYCKKDYEFAPLAVSGKENIICPSCGRVIDKNSRHPVDYSSTENIENNIGSSFASLLRMAYVFYLLFAIVGVIGYILQIDSILYGTTAIVMLTFMIQLCTGTLVFTSGIVLIPIGAFAGYYLFNSINGAFLGIHLVFLVRHICRDIIYTLIFKLIKLTKES